MEVQTLKSKFFNDAIVTNKDDRFDVIERFIIVQRWEWEYEEAHQFQKLAHQYVLEDPSKVIIILCNHPTCFTMGRGLQKKSGKVIENLIETSFEDRQNFPYPVYKINRGGGLTYHYPGQLIIYPIFKLGGQNPSLSLLAKNLFTSLIDASKEIAGVELYENSGDLIGLWTKTIMGEKKLASFGVGIERFITQHGVAFNLKHGEVFDYLKSIYPCGINGGVYSHLEELRKELISLSSFQKSLELKLLNSFSRRPE